AQNSIGIGPRFEHVTRSDARKRAFIEAEYPGYSLEIEKFALMYADIRLGDMEKAVKHVLENLVPAVEQARQLPRIEIVAGDITLGKIEEPVDVCEFMFWNMEYPLERRNLLACHDAVGLGHLCAERDEADCECDGLVWRSRPCIDETRKEASKRATDCSNCLGGARPNGHNWIWLG